jgi:hypothetical protein
MASRSTRAGRVYVSSFSGVQVHRPEGDLLGEIQLPGAVNFTFGGRERNLLFITADGAIWVAVLQAVGGDDDQHNVTPPLTHPSERKPDSWDTSTGKRASR